MSADKTHVLTTPAGVVSDGLHRALARSWRTLSWTPRTTVDRHAGKPRSAQCFQSSVNARLVKAQIKATAPKQRNTGDTGCHDHLLDEDMSDGPTFSDPHTLRHSDLGETERLSHDTAVAKIVGMPD